jgi:hypothetical protein
MTIAVILACEKLSLTEGYETHLCYLSQSKHYQENNYEELIKIPADTGLRYTCTYSLQKLLWLKWGLVRGNSSHTYQAQL